MWQKGKANFVPEPSHARSKANFELATSEDYPILGGGMLLFAGLLLDFLKHIFRMTGKKFLNF